MAMFKTKSAPGNLESASSSGQNNSGGPSRKRKSSATLAVKEWQISGSEKMAIARAILQEKTEHFTQRVTYRFYAFTHICHPFKRYAKRKAKKQSMLASTERRMEKEATAKSTAAEQRVQIRAARLAASGESTSLLQGSSQASGENTSLLQGSSQT